MLFAAALLVLAVLVVPVSPAGAEDGSDSNVPTQDIVPKPNSGEAPEDAGDRGGALQLLLPVLLLAAIGGGAWHISRQARRAAARRDDGAPAQR